MSVLPSHPITWGCDVRAGVVAFGRLGGGLPPTTWQASIADPKLRGAQRLHAYRLAITAEFVRPRSVPFPSAIVIEIPQMRGASQVVLMTHVGVTMEWLQSRFPCAQLELKSAEWKKMAGIGGGADKAVVYAKACELGLNRTQRPTRQDEADALVMALAARNALAQSSPC